MIDLEGQISLFGEQELTEKLNFLHIIKDMQPIQMNIEEIFDPELFDELLAVTFVASPKFFLTQQKSLKK